MSNLIPCKYIKIKGSNSTALERMGDVVII